MSNSRDITNITFCSLYTELNSYHLPLFFIKNDALDIESKGCTLLTITVIVRSPVLAHPKLLRCSAVRPPTGVLGINAFESRMVLSVVREKGTRDQALHLLCHARLFHDAYLTFFLCG